MHEVDSVRIARMEEGLVRLHERISTNHNEVMGALKPAVKESRTNSDDIIRLKQNNKWMFALVFLFPPSLLAAFQICNHYFGSG